MKKLSVIAVSVFVTVFSSCTHRLTDFTIISTKNVDLSRAGTFKRTSSRVEGKDRVHIILGIPIGSPNMKDAIDRAIESTKGAVALVDGVVYSKTLWALLYGQAMFVVEGTPLMDPSIAAVERPADDAYTFVTLDKQGKVKNSRQILPEEYARLKAKIVKGAKKSTVENGAKSAMK